MKALAVVAAVVLAASCATPANAPAATQGGLTVIGADTPADVPDLIRYTTKKSIVSKGKRLNYTVEVYEHVHRNAAGEPQATSSTFTYLLDGVADPSSRPVLFAFNGGPGSSSVWQHLGIYGPRRVKLDDPVKPPVTPPFALEDNPHTILDIADIVMIDPVGTGYSRLLKPDAAKDFYGVSQDAVAVGLLIEDWLTRHNRWNSPKFLGGESYGTTRSAVLAHNLMGGPLSPMGRMTAITLNGVIILGPAMGTENRPPAGVINLPSATAAAWHFKRAGQGKTLEAFQAEVQAFIRDDYAPALAAGEIAPERRAAVAAKLAQLTGLTQDLIEKNNLQVSLETVRANLLKDQGIQIGSYDARYTLPINDRVGPPDPVVDEPAMGQYTPAFIHAFQLYMNELGLEVRRPYDAIAWDGVNFRWNNTPTGRGPKTPLQSIVSAMNRNEKLSVLIGAGWYDFVTTVGGADEIARAIGFGPERVVVKKYTSGHMPYLGEESATQLEADIRAFIARQTR